MKKYVIAIIAGIICGIILAMLAFQGIVVFRMFFPWEITTLLVASLQVIHVLTESFPDMPMEVIVPYIIALTLVGLGGLTFFVAGMLAIKLNSGNMTGFPDAVVLGAIAGLTAEIIHRMFAMLFDAFANLAIGGNSFIFYGYELWMIIYVVSLVLGVLLAIAGALVYYSLYKRGHFS